MENLQPEPAPAQLVEKNPDFNTSPAHQVPFSTNNDYMRVLLISLSAFGVWIASLVLIAIIPALLFFPYAASQGLNFSDLLAVAEFAKSNPSAIFVQMLGVLPAHLLTLAVAWILITRGKKFSFFKTLGWERGGFRWWHYVVILIGFFVIAAIVQQFLPEQENEMIRMLRSSRSVVYVVAFMATFTAPLAEEVIYRGVLYSAFRRAVGVPASFVMVTLLFALVHLPQYYPSYSTMIMLTLLSVVLTAIRVRSDSLLPCVIFHTVFNGVQSVLLIIEPLLPKEAVPEPVPTAFFALFP